MSISLDALVDQISARSPLSPACRRINAWADDPHSSTWELGLAMEQDTRLSRRLLRMLNSPFYGFPSQITTVSRALTVVGGHDLRHLFLAAAAVDALGRLEPQNAGAERFWRHSLHCAVAARLLAVHRGDPAPERFFLAGLLHEAGTHVVQQVFPDLFQACVAQAEDSGDELEAVERTRLGFSHAEIGAALARHWGLGTALEQAILYHHEPSQCREYPMEAALIHIADYIAQSIDPHGEPSPHSLEIDPRAWDIAGLPVWALDTVRGKLAARFEQLYAAFFQDTAAA